MKDSIKTTAGWSMNAWIWLDDFTAADQVISGVCFPLIEPLVALSGSVKTRRRLVDAEVS